MLTVPPFVRSWRREKKDDKEPGKGYNSRFFIGVCVVSLIILDRDGVINEESHAYIKSPEEWQAIPGSLKAIAALNRAGFEVVVATNQSGLARGLFDLATLDAIHAKLIRELAAF